jgi:hypothetical protein
VGGAVDAQPGCRAGTYTANPDTAETGVRKSSPQAGSNRHLISALAVCPPDHTNVGKKHASNCSNAGKAPRGLWKKYQTVFPPPADLPVVEKALREVSI